MTFSFCKGLVIMNHFQFIKSIPIKYRERKRFVYKPLAFDSRSGR
ncbi:hypothetical protein HMPREF1553_00759 [Porphyromonas gingivalis F0568]|nr:hypothetical protein HMPREF1553_00759 [Porphyromonas gingivalis F0568]